MKICAPHWKALQAAIALRGMDKLVSQDGKEAAMRLSEEFEGKEAPFDPLMSCSMMIMSTALCMGGLYLLSTDCCPVCKAIKNIHNATKEEVEKDWIDGPADAALIHCQDHNLL